MGANTSLIRANALTIVDAAATDTSNDWAYWGRIGAMSP